MLYYVINPPMSPTLGHLSQYMGLKATLAENTKKFKLCLNEETSKKPVLKKYKIKKRKNTIA